MFHGSLLGHILSVVTFLLTLLMVSILIRSRRPPGSTIAWLAVIAMVPYVGIPFFLIFGRRKIMRLTKNPLYQPKPERKKTAGADLTRIRKVLLGSGAPDPAPNSRFDFLESGEDAYRYLLEAIRGAKKSIDIAVFIFSRDEVGKAILKELTQKAETGVSVRLLIDAWGSSIFVRPSFSSLKKAGGQLGYFMPLLHIPFRGNTNLRNHRKTAIFDGEKAWFGGMNFAKEYLGPTPYARRWKDLSIAIAGGSVQDLIDIFESDWAFATGDKLKEPRTTPVVVKQERIAQVVASGPDVLEDSLYQGLLESCFEAQSRIWIATPYFIPDDSLIKGLILACSRGVDVRLLTPKKSNHFFADLSRGSYLRQLVEAGGHVHFLPGMIHAKLTLVDQEFALIGSANFDLRSLFYNFELGVFAYSKSEIDAASAWMGRMLAQSSESYMPPGYFRDLGEGIGRLFGPLL